MVLNALAVIVALTLFGNVAAHSANLPIPGSAIGLSLLACYFVLRGGPDEGSSTLFDTMAPHLSFFFVPAAAGLIAHTEILTEFWFVFAAAIVFGTSLVIVVTGVLAHGLLTLLGRSRTT